MSLAQQAIDRSKARCRSWSLLLQDACKTGRRIALWRVPCKSWNCPKCAKKKAEAVSEKVRQNFTSERVRFLTLTIRPQASLPGAIVHINAAWNRLRLKIQRKYGKFKYFKTIEPQGNTRMPHFHVLISIYVDNNWLGPALASSGFGPIRHITLVRNELVLPYVLKYLRKGIKSLEFIDALIVVNGRRYSFSQGMIMITSSLSLHPIHFYKHGDTSPIDALLNLRWFKISISSGYYPLSLNSNMALFFNPSSVLLLPAPPTSSATPLATT